MSGVELATAYISIVPEGSRIAPEVKRQFGAVDKQAALAGKSSGKKFGGAFGSGLKLLGGAAIGGGVISFLKDSNAEAREAQKVGARTANVIRSTGGAAKISADQVGVLSSAISAKAGIDDEAIQSGANLLLTFKNIRNEAGKNNDIFNRTTKAAVDLSAAGFGDLNGANKQLGKALNDPVKGITALTKSGVTFTDQQKTQIKTLVESGKTLKAQKIILKEVESQVGGSAAAQATAGDKAAVAMGNLKEQVGTALLPTVDKLATLTSEKVVPAISDFVTGMQDGTGAGGKVADVLGDIYDVGKKTVDVIDGLPGPVKKFGAEGLIALAVFSKFGPMIGGVGASVGTFATGLGNADTRAARLASTSQRLGAGLRTAAGAGGMLLLADGASKGATSMGVLESAAGGALSGAALGAFGGPVGAAIGAGIGGLAGGMFALSKSTDDANKSAKVAIGSYKEYASTLDGVSASTTRATRDMVFQRLESSGLLAATRALGLSDRTAINASLGNGKARAKLSEALRATTKITYQQQQALRAETGAVGASRLEQLRKNVAIAKGAGETRAARTALKNFMAEPASKRVSISGVEDADRKLRDLRNVLRSIVTGTPGNGAINLNVNHSSGLPLGGGPRKKRREFGGPVTAGQSYIVGEKRPELFIPNQSGRIVPRVPSAAAGGGQRTGGFSGPITVSIDGMDFEAYMTAIAEDVVGGN